MTSASAHHRDIGAAVHREPPRHLYELSLLRPFALVGPRGPVDLGSRKLSGLFAYLASAGSEGQLRAKLSTLLWGSHFDVQARQNLRKSLSRLRQALDDDLLVSNDERVALRPGLVTSDVQRFEALLQMETPEALAEAVDLYDGPFLADLSIREERWIEWVTAQRRRLEGLAVTALVRLGEYSLEEGSVARALERATRALAIDNLREDAHGLSICALGMMDRRGEALQQYEQLCALLKQKLNVEPDAKITAIAAELRRASYAGNGSVMATKPMAELRSPNGRASSFAERRQLSVLACRIHGLHGSAAEADPEDIHHTIAAVRTACREVAARFGGMLDKAVGDGLLVYFGFPQAREDDAERALRAGMEMTRAAKSAGAAAFPSLHLRIGIATGLMVIGDLATDESGVAFDAVGEPLNQALRLRGAADAGEIVIAHDTRSLAGGVFEYERLDAPGDGAEPLLGWRVLGESGAVVRFETSSDLAMSEFVDRNEELDVLLRCWAKARTGAGQMVLATGEPGIGKSRILFEFRERAGVGAPSVLRFFGSQRHADAPFSALIDELNRSLGIDRIAAPADRLARLSASAGLPGGLVEGEIAALSEILSLPAEQQSVVAQFAPAKRREKIFAALLARIERLAERAPVLILAEDAQWIDPTSLEFFSLLVERLPKLPVMMLMSARPEFAPAWPSHAHVTVLTVPRLGAEAAAMLAGHVAGDRPLPPEVVRQIFARTDGIPLFVEELTKTVLESGLMRRAGDGYEILSSDLSSSIPKALHTSLLARLDRLGRSRDVAQIGAVIGREFRHELLRMVTPMREPELNAALARLIESGLVFRRGMPPLATYVFKHALVRDAAYSTFVRERRRVLHAAIARALEDSFPETAAAQPELLAYHWREAAENRKAAAYLLTAAERGLLRSAPAEALTQLRQALALLSAIAEDHERRRLELRLQIALGRALIAKLGYTAPEARQAYRRARELCDVLEDQKLAPLITFGHWLATWTAADYPAALEQATELQRWGEREGDESGIGIGHLLSGVTLTLIGEPDRALTHIEQAAAIDRFVLTGLSSFVSSGADGRMTTLTYKHYCLWLLGRLREAEAAKLRAIREAPEPLETSALAQTHWCRIHSLERDPVRTEAVATRLVQLASEQGASYFVAMGLVYLGWARAQISGGAEGIASCAKGITDLQALGAKCALPRYTALLAESYEAAGDTENAFRTISGAFAAMESTGERVWEAELYRRKGLLLQRGGKPQDAEECFARALATARRQEARLLELRAATSLAEHMAEQGRRDAARAVLAPVHDGFSGEFLHPELAEANALRNALS